MRLVLGESISQIDFDQIIQRISTNLDVCHPVVVKIGAGCETLSTGFTLVWLLPSVDLPVPQKGFWDWQATLASTWGSEKVVHFSGGHEDILVKTTKCVIKEGMNKGLRQLI